MALTCNGCGSPIPPHPGPGPKPTKFCSKRCRRAAYTRDPHRVANEEALKAAQAAYERAVAERDAAAASNTHLP